MVEAREEILGLFEQVREPMSVPGKDLALTLEDYSSMPTAWPRPPAAAFSRFDVLLEVGNMF